MSNLSNNTTELQNILEAINALPDIHVPSLQEKTIAPSTSQQEVLPDDGMDGLSKVTVEAMPVVEQATPEITFSNDNAVFEVSVTQQEGYVAGGTKSAKKALMFIESRVVTPTTIDQEIPARCYIQGRQIIKGDSNLLPENIAEGVSIFGVEGTLHEPNLMPVAVSAVKEQVRVTPPDGYDGFSEIIIAGDADFLPENIKEGVNIFGVVGTLAAGGGVLSATGSLVSANGSSQLTLTHNLGLTPNFFAFNGTMFNSLFSGMYFVSSDGTISINGYKSSAFGVQGVNDTNFELAISNGENNITFGIKYQGGTMQMSNVDISWIVGVI